MTGLEGAIKQQSREIKFPSLSNFITRVLGNRRIHSATKAVPITVKDNSVSDKVIDQMMAAELASNVSRITGEYVDPLPLEVLMTLKRSTTTSTPKK